MNKRGSEDKLFFIMWELIAFAAVLIIILVVVRDVANDTTYWKRYYSTDIALMADIENVNQGDFVMNYALKEPMDNFWTDIYMIDKKIVEITLKPDRVEVYDYPKEDSKVPYTFPFAKHKNINVVNESTSSLFLVLSKIGNELKLSNYAVETAEVCPSYDTRKNTSLIILDSIFLDPKTKPHSESIKATLKKYGRDPAAISESTIILGYSKNFTIYYSDDIKTLQSQKLSCLIRMKLEESLNNTAELKRYDKSLDADSEFQKYISGKPQDEYWVILMLSDNETRINQNDFAGIIEKAVAEYYE